MTGIDFMVNQTSSRVEMTARIIRFILTTTETIAANPTTTTTQKVLTSPKMTTNHTKAVTVAMKKMIEMNVMTMIITHKVMTMMRMVTAQTEMNMMTMSTTHVEMTITANHMMMLVILVTRQIAKPNHKLENNDEKPHNNENFPIN